MTRALLLLATAAPALVAAVRRDATCSLGEGVCPGEPVARDSVLLQVEGAVRKGRDTSAAAPNASAGVGLEQLVEESDALQGASPSADELEHFRLVKALRAQGWTCPNGRRFAPNGGEFEWDCRLWRAGRGWAQRMARESFWHHRRGDSTPCSRTEAEGFPRLRGCGSAIVKRKKSPRAALEDLKRSPDHCHIFMDPVYNKMGAGFGSSSSATDKYYWSDALGSWHQGPDQSCIGGSPAPSPPPGCADIETVNCGFYKDQGYCTLSPSVMRECRETCGIDGCGQPSPSPSPSPAGAQCKDTADHCAHYEREGYCATSESVKTGCKRTCGLCGAPVRCEDTAGHCDHYKKEGYCATSPNVQTGCKKTCGLC